MANAKINKSKPEINWLKLIASIVICQAAGIIGSIFTFAAIPTWYALLAKPTFAPPNWIFAPVWTLLFLLMGIALYLVWEKGATRETKLPLSLFAIQLALNVTWSFLFFSLRDPASAFIVIILLWVAIAVTLLSFYSISRKAGWLMVPYLLWVTFAAYLNLTILLLNLTISN
ncbi:MAG: TspO/MBR family protein [Candidatus Micrarchaeota archaeon]